MFGRRSDHVRSCLVVHRLQRVRKGIDFLSRQVNRSERQPRGILVVQKVEQLSVRWWLLACGLSSLRVMFSSPVHLTSPALLDASFPLFLPLLLVAPQLLHLRLISFECTCEAWETHKATDVLARFESQDAFNEYEDRFMHFAAHSTGLEEALSRREGPEL